MLILILTWFMHQILREKNGLRGYGGDSTSTRAVRRNTIWDSQIIILSQTLL